MSCNGTSGCDCGCCAGTSVQTPQPRSNAPGLSSVSYRVGAWASFKESMLARLSSSDYPALSKLRTRDDDDFTIAYLDATAMMLDVLTFYQERLANESYLRTAGQLRSLTELSRLIGYRPAPGVSASAYAAFSLKAAPGLAPNPSNPAIVIPQGTQVQSVPGQAQTPQTFETSADIPAKADWSSLPVQTAKPWAPQIGDTYVYLAGTVTQLQPGDLILIVGDERLNNPTSSHWDVRAIVTVNPDALNNRTCVTWSEGLGYGSVAPAQSHPKFYAFRQRATLFGYNAINPMMLAAGTVATLSGGIQTGQGTPIPNAASPGTKFAAGDKVVVSGGDNNAILQIVSVTSSSAVTGALTIVQPGTGYTSGNFSATAISGTGTGLQVGITAGTQLKGSDWNFQEPSTTEPLVDLDGTYPKLVAGGWIVLDRPGQVSSRSPSGWLELCHIESATVISRSGYSISGKISRLLTDSSIANLNSYYATTRQTSVLAQSELLAVAPQPLTYPLFGALLDLRDLRPDLAGATVVALSGKRQKIAVADGVTNLVFIQDGGGNSLPLNPGDVLTLTDPAPLAPFSSSQSFTDWRSSSARFVTLNVQDANGRTGTVTALLSQFTLALSGAADPNVSEYALVSAVLAPTDPYPHTQLRLASALANCYDRTATTVNANVVLATCGQSVSELMGSGNASTPNQSFTLKQSPLTYVQAPTETGRQSTLQVKANGAAWTEVPSLYGEGSSMQVFATINQSDGTADVLFGDGVEGSLLPTGQNNVMANYRTGLGSAGNVGANTLTTLVDRPLGVSGVTNPSPATGGQDPDTVDDIRSGAPLSVLTLGRAVSLADYQNYASTFAGIAKAYAVWIPGGPGRGVFLTVAGVGGAALPDGSPALTNLVASLQNYGNPLIPITVRSFLETHFGFSADLKYDPAYSQPDVRARVQQTLAQAYSFATRNFGQGVSGDELAAVIQAVPGVVAVNVKEIHAVATSAAGDLAAASGPFVLSSLYRWQALQLRIALLRPYSSSPARLNAWLPVASSTSLPQPAEILVLDPNPDSTTLGVMA